ncbi:MAG TPA: peptide ABC transporter substrate-binding protein [bacterium]|nr:peptide ABC transporter substrate-binding protein [bacterium]
MRRLKRTLTGTIFTVAWLALVAGLIAIPGPPAGNTAAAATPDTLTIAYPLEPDTLNPYATHIPAVGDMGLAEGFVTNDEKMRYIPLLAQQVPLLSNGGVKLVGQKMVVTWKLKPGLKWSDGQPVTSADAVFTYKAMIDTTFRVDTRPGWNLIESVETPDDLTVVATFKTPYSGYIVNTFRFLMPKHILEGQDLNTYTPYNRSPVLTGPYKVESWQPGQTLVEVANPYYRGAAQGLPHIKRIVWRFVQDPNTRINMVKTGEAQVAWLVPFDQIKALQATPNVKVVIYPLNAWMHFDFNLKRPMWQDVRVRQAVAYAIDKRGIVTSVLGGLGTVAGPPMTPLTWAYDGKAYGQYPYNPEKAKQLLAAAGWTPGSNGVLQKDGQALTFENCNATGDATQDRVQQVIQAELRAVGMDMQIHNYSSTVYGEIRVTGKCDTLFHRWKIGAPPALSIFYSADALPPNGLNEDFYVNKDVTDVINQAEQEIDPAKAKPLFWKAQEMLGQDVPTIPVYYMVSATATSSKLAGLTGNPSNAGDGWNIEQWRYTQ